VQVSPPRQLIGDATASSAKVLRTEREEGMRLLAGARTDTGRVRALNEDVYVSRPERGLFVECDGMGGAPAGEVASQVAIETILEQLEGGDEVAVDSTPLPRFASCQGRIGLRSDYGCR
jgi:hypothetical protein